MLDPFAHRRAFPVKADAVRDEGDEFEPKSGGLRRSMGFAALDRYVSGALNLLALVVLSRLLAPAEIGLVLLAGGLLALLEAFRDFGVGVFLIQEKDIRREDVRSAFTAGLVLSVALAAAIIAVADPVAALYGDPALAPVLRISALALLAAPFIGPITALLRRRLAFDAVAAVSVVNAGTNCAVAILLAWLGFGAMSLVWAGVVAAAASALVAFRFAPGLWMFVPTLRSWRKVAAFGGWSSATVVLNVFHAALPALLLGRTAGMEAVGLFGRAQQLCQLPERLILGALQPVILPALSDHARNGGDPKAVWLGGLGLAAAVQWPFLACLALTAEPLTVLVLGPQWVGAAPILSLMAVASMTMLPAFMTFPLLVSLGRIRDTFSASMISLPPSFAITAATAPFGAEAVAASMLVTGPLQIAVALAFIRRRMPFDLRELAAALAPAALVTACTVAVPAILLLSVGPAPSGPVSVGTAAATVAVWAASLFLLRHPLAGEIRRALRAGLRMLRSRSASAAPPSA